MSHVLKHDAPKLYSNEQPYWEFCENCHGLFYNGNNDKGKCPATPRVMLLNGDRVHIGGHKRHPQAFHFVLRFETPAPLGYTLNVGCGWPPNPSVCPGY